MKLRNIVLFGLMLISSINFAQTKEIKIQYKVYPTFGSLENQDDVKNSKMSYLYEGLDRVISELRYELYIKGKKSCFMMLENRGIAPKSISIAKTFAGKNDYLIDKESNTFIKRTRFFNELFFVHFTQDANWELINETKTVGDYKCYKATLKRSVVLDGKSKDYQVIAWFSPELPYEFGPKEFGGLPGLILELQDDKVTFVASKIEFGTDLFKSFRIENEIIAEENYNAMVNKKGEEFLNEMNTRK